MTSDILIIGGGIVGLSTAYCLLKQNPSCLVVVVEKESSLAEHQSGRNSGVLHSAIQYKPGSFQAEICGEGRRAMIEFCSEEGLELEICGKIIVARNEAELPRLKFLHNQAVIGSIDCRLVNGEQLREIEPHAAGVGAIHVMETGIVDFRKVCERLGQRIQALGGRILLDTRVTGFESNSSSLIVTTTKGEFNTRQALNCGGLYSDRLTRSSGAEPRAKIVPFRGEYFKLSTEAQSLVRHMIYPLPDPALPFPGVHFTRVSGGGVECGPNAVLAFAREGYGKGQINLNDLMESLTYPGFIKLASRHWKTGVEEFWRSLSKSAFQRALAQLVPEIRAEHLLPAPAGVRALGIDPMGATLEGFHFVDQERVLNVVNSPAPAATTALTVGRIIAEKLRAKAGAGLV